MINSINSVNYSYPVYGNSNINSIFDYPSAVNEANKKAQELLESLKNVKTGSVTTVKSLQQDSAAFLNAYTSSIKSLDQSAEKLRNGNLDKLLYDKNGEVTDTTVKNTVDAFKDMIAKYNSTLKLLNDNADRGPGVMKQLARMAASDPASEANMAKLGVSVNKDGTIALNEEKLSSALKTENTAELKNIKNIIGGLNGVADNVHMHAMYGSTMSSRQLVGNDVQKSNALKQENPFYVLYQQIKGKAYALQDMAYAGLILNKQI